MAPETAAGTNRLVLLLDRSLQLFFDAGNFCDEPASVPFSIINLDAAGNPVTVFLHPLIALPDNSKDVVPLPFQDRAHRIEAIGDTALVDDDQRTGDVLAHALAFSQGRHAEFQENHGVLYAFPFAPDAAVARSSSHTLGYCTLPNNRKPSNASRNIVRRFSTSGSLLFACSRS